MSVRLEDPLGYALNKDSGVHTCWHRYELPLRLRMTVAHIRSTPCARREGIHRRWLACGPDRKFGSWDQAHRG